MGSIGNKLGVAAGVALLAIATQAPGGNSSTNNQSSTSAPPPSGGGTSIYQSTNPFTPQYSDENKPPSKPQEQARQDQEDVVREADQRAGIATPPSPEPTHGVRASSTASDLAAQIPQEKNTGSNSTIPGVGNGATSIGNEAFATSGRPLAIVPPKNPGPG